MAMKLALRQMRARSEQTFPDLVALTHGLLVEAGLPVIGAGFVAYWLSRDKTPEEIVAIATGKSARPDAHLGGTEDMRPAIDPTDEPTLDEVLSLLPPALPPAGSDRAEGETPDRFGAAMGAAALAVANVDRVLRHQPTVTSPLELHHDRLCACHAAALDAFINRVSRECQ